MIKSDIDKLFNFDDDIDKIYRLYYRHKPAYRVLVTLIELHSQLDCYTRNIPLKTIAYEIGDTFGMSTIYNHLSGLYKMFGVKNQSDLIKVTSKILDKMVAKSGACHE